MKDIMESIVIFCAGAFFLGLLVFANELEKASKVSGCRSGLETLIKGSCDE